MVEWIRTQIPAAVASHETGNTDVTWSTKFTAVIENSCFEKVDTIEWNFNKNIIIS